MTWRLINVKSVLALAVLFLVTASCNDSKPKSGFAYRLPGYWWRLIAFSNDSAPAANGKIAWISATFKTSGDSVFYDSTHDVRDRFFIRTDTLQRENLLRHLVSRCSKGDSVSALIPSAYFFKQQFNSALPLFCVNDTVIKVDLKVKDLLSEEAFAETTSAIIINETKEIEAWFGSAQKTEAARDSLGFYWVERPRESGSHAEPVKKGDVISISYQGGFLNGRMVDISRQDFVITYGTPDQLIKGLNYVIGRLKVGQDSKIILPSQLAFGENGSSNGSIPPYTPMLYKISITQKK